MKFKEWDLVRIKDLDYIDLWYNYDRGRRTGKIVRITGFKSPDSRRIDVYHTDFLWWYNYRPEDALEFVHDFSLLNDIIV